MFAKIQCSLIAVVLAAAPALAQTQLTAPNEVILCDGKHYVSACVNYKVGPSMRHKLVPALSKRGFNDRTSSVRVGADVEAWLFEHANFAGEFIKLGEDTPSLERLYNKGSSLMVVAKGRPQAGGGVALSSYKEANVFSTGRLRQQFFPLSEQANEAKAAYFSISYSDVDGNVNYVSLSSGVEAVLYPARDLGGDPLQLPGALPQTRKPRYNYGIHTYTYNPDGPSGHVVYKLNDFGLMQLFYAAVPTTQVRSLQVRVHGGYHQLDPQEALVCRHREFVGLCQSFKIEPGARHKYVMMLEQFGLAGADSAAVGSEVTAWLFQGKWYETPDQRVTESNGNLKIKPVSLVVHPHRGGYATGVFLDRAFMPAPEVGDTWESREVWDLNDEISNVRLCGPTSLTLYEHVDFNGKPISFPGYGEPAPFPGECHHFKLKTWGFEDRASSYKARMQPTPVHPGAYKITLKTGDKKDAGTDAGVWVTLIGDQASPQEFRLDTSQDDRERGQIDAYWVSGHPAEIRSVRVRHDNRNDGPGWFLEEVRVQDLASLTEWIFQTNVWLAKDRPAGIDETFHNPDVHRQLHKAIVPDVGALASHVVLSRLQNGLEQGVRYPGQQYKELLLDQPVALACAQACVDERPKCVAFTYFEPGFMPGKDPNKGFCSLKQEVPQGVLDQPCCISGVIDPAIALADAGMLHSIAERLTEPKAKLMTTPGTIVPHPGQTLMDPGKISTAVLDNTDFPGLDLPGSPIPYLKDGSPERCAQDCLASSACAAFTFVKSDPLGVSLCWLKQAVADESLREQKSNPNCASGLRPGIGPDLPPAYPQVATENFDAGLSEQWKVYGEGMTVENGMLTCKDNSAVASTLPLPPEFVLDFNYRHGTGVGAVVLHGHEGPDTPQYRVWFLNDRVQIVRRSGGPQLFVVAESDLAPPLGFVAGQTYAVKIGVKTGRITVATDGKVRVGYTDPQPLPPGFGALGCGNGQGFGFDDLVFSVTGAAPPQEEAAAPTETPGPVAPQQPMRQVKDGLGEALVQMAIGELLPQLKGQLMPNHDWGKGKLKLARGDVREGSKARLVSGTLLIYEGDQPLGFVKVIAGRFELYDLETGTYRLVFHSWDGKLHGEANVQLEQGKLSRIVMVAN